MLFRSETGPATPRHPGSSAPRAKRPVDLLARRPLYWIAALASVAIVLLIGIEITQDRTRVLDDARADARHIRDALVEHTRQTFAAIDVALESTAEDIDPASLSSTDTHRTLAARTKAIAPALTLWVLDKRGVMVASSHAEIPASMDLAQGDTFRHHEAVVEDGIFVAQPRLGVFGPTRDQWVLTVSRRLDDADGEFAGVVASSVSIEYQNNFYNAVRPGDTGIIGLFHINGPILAGSPFSPDHNGFDASETTRFHELLPTSQSGMLRADMIDGINRIKAYAWVPGLPLVVLVGVGTAERLGGWRNRAITEASIGGLAIALIWLLATSLRRRVKIGRAHV